MFTDGIFHDQFMKHMNRKSSVNIFEWLDKLIINLNS